MNKRKIAIVTGSRAEYGLLYWIMRGIVTDPSLDLQLIVTGMHLASEFGSTVNDVEKDGFSISEKVDMLIPADNEEAISGSMGRGVIGFARAYAKLKPDIIVLLGDRFEIHAAASAAIPFRIPIAHIHGGELTEGAFDDQLRHSITKMSHIHFPSTELYKKRIIQMGENPENVHCFGSPAIDNILRLEALSREGLCEELGVPKDADIGVLTYHPVTLEAKTAGYCITEILYALSKVKSIYWVFTAANADTDNRVILKKTEEFAIKHPEKVKLHKSLGQKRYLSLLKHASLMVGNSSSGLIEGPSFGLPVVNIGDRQRGRIRAANVIDVDSCNSDMILASINRALSPKFKDGLKGLENPYGRGGASENIIDILKTVKLGEALIKKRFYDI